MWTCAGVSGPQIPMVRVYKLIWVNVLTALSSFSLSLWIKTYTLAPMEAVLTRRQWNGIQKVLKRKNQKQPTTRQSIILHPVKISQRLQQTCILRHSKQNSSGATEMVPDGKWNLYKAWQNVKPVGKYNRLSLTCFKISLEIINSSE